MVEQPTRQQRVTGTSGNTAADVPSSAWSPFRHAAFTVLWIATVVANVGSWMYNAASGWLMTSLDPEPLVVSMVQVATTLPMFLFAIPAGALADIVDKRRLLIIAEVAATVVSAIYAAIVSLNLATAGNLLLFTFLIGVTSALTAPAWQAVVPRLVPMPVRGASRDIHRRSRYSRDAVTRSDWRTPRDVGTPGGNAPA